MNGFWLIFKHEYRKKTAQKGFYITTFGVPLVILLVMGISIFAAIGTGGSRVIGYVDEAGLIMPAADASRLEDETVEIRAYPDREAAEKALSAEEVRAYYVVPADYLETGKLDMYYQKRAPNETMQAAFRQLLRASLALKMIETSQFAPQVLDQPTVTIRSMDGSREVSQGSFISLVLPFVASFILVFTVMMTGGALLQVVADEKENRTIEILVTCLTPEQLIGGKALALMAVCLTQLAIWLAAGAAGLGIGALFFEPLRQAAIPWELLVIIALFFLPAYALLAGIMTAVGGAAGEMRQGQQIGGLLNMVFLLPLFMTAQILQSPNSPLVVAMTLFPATSFCTVVMRWSLGSVPLWQLVVGWVLLVGSSAATIILAARIFRLGMLRYGKGLNLRSIMADVFSRA